MDIQIDIDEIKRLPEDVILYIGKFYNPKIDIALKRISKIKNKLFEMKDRSPDQWIQHMQMSPQLYDVDVHENTERLHYTHKPKSIWTSRYYSIIKSTIIDHECIKDIMQKGRNYIRRIVCWTLPTPRYKGQPYVNILKKQMVAKYVSYKGIDGKNYYNTLTFVSVTL